MNCVVVISPLDKSNNVCGIKPKWSYAGLEVNCVEVERFSMNSLRLPVVTDSKITRKREQISFRHPRRLYALLFSAPRYVFVMIKSLLYAKISVVGVT